MAAHSVRRRADVKFLDGVPRQLRFRHDDEPRRDGDALSGTGQLIAAEIRRTHAAGLD